LWFELHFRGQNGLDYGDFSLNFVYFFMQLSFLFDWRLNSWNGEFYRKIILLQRVVNLKTDLSYF
jgi:hypothetical protein